MYYYQNTPPPPVPPPLSTAAATLSRYENQKRRDCNTFNQYLRNHRPLISHPMHCPCPLRQGWGSLDAIVGRLRSAFEENGERPEENPFGTRSVRLYLRDVRDTQGKTHGVIYEKKKRKRSQPLDQQQPVT